jgi:chromosome segregation ATPase
MTAREEGHRIDERDPELLLKELEATKSRLAATEWALEHLSANDGVDDAGLMKMVDEAVDRVEELWSDARQKIEGLVRDAEHLKEIAARQSEEAEARARASVAERTQELLEDTRTLQASAQEKANQMVAEADERMRRAEIEADARLAEAEEMYERVERHVASREAILAEVRKKADQIIRTAKAAAETIRAEARADAERSSEVARLEAARLMQAAKDEARVQLARVTAQERDAKERLANARAEISS